MALITCKECGAQISEFADSCPNCGIATKATATPVATVQNQQQGQSRPAPSAANGNQNLDIPPKTWLVESILVTIFCCPPFGIPGIVNAAKVESRWYAGDKEGSLKASQEAKKWTLIGLIGGGIFLVIYMILLFAGIASSLY